MVQPVAALHQQQGFGHGDSKQKQAEFITEAAKSRPAQQQRHRRHKGQGAEQAQQRGLVKDTPQQSVAVELGGEDQPQAAAFLVKQDVGLEDAKPHTGENAAAHQHLIANIFCAGVYEISNQQHQQRRGESEDQVCLKGGGCR